MTQHNILQLCDQRERREEVLLMVDRVGNGHRNRNFVLECALMGGDAGLLDSRLFPSLRQGECA